MSQDPEEREEGQRGPRSVRDSMGPPAPASRATGAEKSSGRDGEKDDEGARPTPVREMMGRDPASDAVQVELPRRVFGAEEQEWVVTVVGTSVTGAPSDPGAPLLHLHFARAEEPDTPLRQLLTVGRDIEDLFDEELRQLLQRARPLRETGPGGS